MRILYIYTDFFKNYDILLTIQQLGIEYDVMEQSFMTWDEEPALVEAFENELRTRRYQLVLSYGYVPYISDACERCQVLYAAWTYDSILHSLYNKSLENRCNLLFIYDKSEQQYVRSHFDVPHCYYLPLAVNVDRIQTLTASQEQRNYYFSNVSFVGDLYQKNTYYSLEPDLNPAERDYFEQAFAYFHGTWGGDSIYEWFSADDAEYLQKRLPDYLKNDELLPNQRFFADTLLSKPIGSRERIDILNRLAKSTGIRLYHKADTDISVLSGVECRPYVNYYDAMNLAFRYSCVNLNITLHGMISGVPLRCFDVMGSGGFLLTNYQEECVELFEPDHELVIYYNIDELEDKVKYYLQHETERVRIAEKGFERVQAEHTYRHRINRMLEIINDLL